MQLLPDESKASISRADCAKALLDGLPPVMWFIRREMRQHRVHGLSVPQFRMLVLLERYPTASLSCAADHLGCSLPSASRMIQGLVAKDLVVRKTCTDDRRQISLVLTPRGEEVLKVAREATQDCLAEAIESLGEAERRTVAAGMQLLGSIFDARAAAPPCSEMPAGPGNSECVNHG